MPSFINFLFPTDNTSLGTMGADPSAIKPPECDYFETDWRQCPTKGRTTTPKSE